MTAEAMRVGLPYPLGATWDGDGVNFALFSEHAVRVELCLYSDDGAHEIKRYDLPDVSNHVWNGYLPKAAPGTVYGYRVHGPYQPHLGHRFNPHKLLLDPYAKALVGEFVWSDTHFGFESSDADKDTLLDSRDNQHFVPKCKVVVDPQALQVSPANRIAKSKSVIYETHLKGFTMLHPAIPQQERGTFAGLSHPESLAYLKSLGVTSIELLPVQSFISESFLVNKGLSNYWGYNTLSFFTPHQSYLSGNDILECRHAIERIHDAGMEVILDVVFNHTAEGSRLGPTLSFRGIDNLSYYRLQAEDKRFYINDTGCGNTVNLSHPRVVQLVMDCLRYWVTVMGVDGFRFDLAPVLGREAHGFDQGSGFFDALLQDPVLAGIKFIAEPWDIGPGGYQLGRFPAGWSEWNDRFRDTVRRFWRGDPGVLPEFARRIHGSSDIFEHSGRRPSSSINFVTSHDGYTLADLVSYKERHNLANGEDNRDGHHENYSDNFGVEGPTEDTGVNIWRRRQQRNILATSILSQGIPMLLSGDEIGRSQAGNNNAYCQDNELNWFPWEDISDTADQQKIFTRHLLALRQQLHIFALDDYIHEPSDPNDPSMEWYGPTGQLMQASHWGEHHSKTVGSLSTCKIPGTDQQERVLMIFHAGRDAITFQLPELPGVASWEVLFDTGLVTGIPDPDNCTVESRLRLFSCSSVLLRARMDAATESSES
ncbi:glycogen debranching protein GlgX [Pseudomaricurvus sp. HS19]|uniref:glycogen debranching protein GlgX n=1 Tax=Pseudomaricurvus sp. HS19 TaxID=2692626 RepID=UPI00136CB36D|nr:glycogen debranching protein GlgX [Pseudomaricurvus sp. HS19]MYM63324.1 glycogen debranching protein GlgX [Pseudomaricurvus sp. HS19]